MSRQIARNNDQVIVYASKFKLNVKATRYIADYYVQSSAYNDQVNKGLRKCLVFTTCYYIIDNDYKIANRGPCCGHFFIFVRRDSFA